MNRLVVVLLFLFSSCGTSSLSDRVEDIVLPKVTTKTGSPIYLNITYDLPTVDQLSTECPFNNDLPSVIERKLKETDAFVVTKSSKKSHKVRISLRCVIQDDGMTFSAFAFLFTLGILPMANDAGTFTSIQYKSDRKSFVVRDYFKTRKYQTSFTPFPILLGSFPSSNNKHVANYIVAQLVNKLKSTGEVR